MTNSELVGLILDFSGSMDEDAFSGKPKFEVALEVASSLLNRLKASSVSSQFYFSLVGFAAGDEGAFLPPFSEDVPYMSVLELDIDLLSVFKQRFGTSDRLRSEYNRSSTTDYTKGLMKAIKATKIYLEDYQAVYDKTFVTRIMVTDGCHNVGDWRPVYETASELVRLPSTVSLGSIIVGSADMCDKDICEMCTELYKDLKERYERVLRLRNLPRDFGLNQNCPDKFSFIFNSRDKSTMEIVRSILYIASETHKE